MGRIPLEVPSEDEPHPVPICWVSGGSRISFLPTAGPRQRIGGWHLFEGMAVILPSSLPPCCRKCTFDMFNFLASQHRVLPEGATCDEEEDEVQLRSTRYGGQARVLGVSW